MCGAGIGIGYGIFHTATQSVHPDDYFVDRWQGDDSLDTNNNTDTITWNISYKNPKDQLKIYGVESGIYEYGKPETLQVISDNSSATYVLNSSLICNIWMVTTPANIIANNFVSINLKVKTTSPSTFDCWIGTYIEFTYEGSQMYMAEIWTTVHFVDDSPA